MQMTLSSGGSSLLTKSNKSREFLGKQTPAEGKQELLFTVKKKIK